MRPATRGGAARLLSGVLVAVALCATACGTTFRAPIREAVVVFKPGATHSDQVRVHNLCDDVPHANVEPFPTATNKVSTRMFPVRYRVDDASDVDLQKLYTCLQADPSVEGVKLTGVSQ